MNNLCVDNMVIKIKIPFSKPWITSKDVKCVRDVLKNRWLTNGPYLKKFEQSFSKTIGVKYSVGVSSATAGLHLALKSLDVNSGDEVIVPALTFVATANSVIYNNATPILADIDERTFNISPLEIKKKINRKTKAVIVVHYGGQSCNMDEILDICNKKNIVVVEDCAHSLGTKFKSSFCGSIGKIGVFSFYPTKMITTGEGGMICTSEKKLADRLSKLRSHAIDIAPDVREKTGQLFYDINELGYNYRLDEMSAALGNSQLSNLKTIIKKRQECAKVYDHYLSENKNIITPYRDKNSNHVYHLYSIKLTNNSPIKRDELVSELTKNGIGISIQYKPLNKFNFLKNFSKFVDGDFPIANKVYQNILSLPLFVQMKKTETVKVCNTIKTIINLK